ncbi:MAG: hypothetical protein ACLTC4_14355 [Hungatella hathewayi]
MDGYGALAAYAVDSVIQNCGMNGDLYGQSVRSGVSGREGRFG